MTWEFLVHHLSITLVYKGCANEKWLGVFDKFLRVEHESGLKSYPSRIVFEKPEFETSKKSVFDHFWITMDTEPEVLTPSKMSQIEACHFISFWSNPKTP